jgi:DNA helicase IV
MVIDESQDFRRSWWTALEAILTSGADAQVRSFMDRNQRVDLRSEPIPDSAFEIVFPLTRNLRNTQQIFSVAAPFFKSGVTRACGPSGQKVILDSLPRNTLEATERVLYHVGRLGRSENVALDDIAVLCSRKADAEAVGQRLTDKKYVVRDAGQYEDSGKICVDTVRRFKGLEAKVVIIHWADAFDNETLLYVAATRAQGLLILTGSDQYLSKIAVGEAVDRIDS